MTNKATRCIDSNGPFARAISDTDVSECQHLLVGTLSSAQVPCNPSPAQKLGEVFSPAGVHAKNLLVALVMRQLTKKKYAQGRYGGMGSVTSALRLPTRSLSALQLIAH